MKSHYVMAASLSLAMLAACSPQPPVTQPVHRPEATQTASHPSLVKAGQAATSAQISQSAAGESLAFSFALPRQFSTQFADSSRLASVRFEVSGTGLSSPVSVDADVVNGTASGRISGLPLRDGGLRIVTATGYDQAMNPLAAFSASAEYVPHSSTSSVSLVLSRRRLLLDRFLMAMLSQSLPIAALNFEALQAQFEQAMGYRASSGDFVNQPEQYDIDTLLTLPMLDGSFGTTGDINAYALGSLGNASIRLELPAGLLSNENLTLLVTDPASEPLGLPAGSQTGFYRVPGISPGSWQLEVRTSAGELIAATSATVTPSGEVELGTPSLSVSDIGFVDPEVRVNSATLNEQNHTSVAMSAAGDFVITWDSAQLSGNGTDVYMQRYNSLGQAQGAETLVNSFTTAAQSMPDVCMSAEGDYVITWQSENQDGQSFGIYGRRFDRDGTPQGGETRINDTTLGSQDAPAIACDSSGNYLIAWNDQTPLGRVTAKHFNSGGSQIGAEFRVADTTTLNQTVAGVGLADDGHYVIAWNMEDGDRFGTFTRGFANTGVAETGDMLVHDATGSQIQASLSMDSDGEYVVTWSDKQSSKYAVKTRHYARDYQALSPAVSVYATLNNQYNSEANLLPDGTFNVVWSEETTDGSILGVFSNHFTADGIPLGDRFQVNTYTSNVQNFPALASDADGDYVIGWSSQEQIGNGYEVYHKRYTAHDVPRRPGF